MGSMRRSTVQTVAALALFALAGCGGSKGGNGTAPPVVVPGALSLTTVGTITGGGSHMPVLAVSPPGDVHRLFVVDKAGVIRIIKDDVLLPKPFLDIQSLVDAVYEERGMLGLAFSPNYATDRTFYVCYTATAGNLYAVTLARYQTTSANPDSADAGTGLVVFHQNHDSFGNHNGGMIAFGPDGYLYMSIGDGGGQDDPHGNGQDIDTNWLGSIVRLDVSGGGPAIAAAGNPFPDASHPSALPETWCYGLRNPWRFSFDRANGDLYIGDVGQDTKEEIDVATAASGRGKGVNFGWSIMEADICHPPGTACSSSGLTLPVISYDHDANQNCVIGGYVYRGAAMPGLAGTYFYSDNYGRWLKSFQFVGGVASNQKDWGVALAPSGDGVNGFGQDARGEIYVCCTKGAVKRIGP